MAWILDKNGMTDPREGSAMRWSEITSVGVARYEEGARLKDAISVSAYDADGDGESHGIGAREKGFPAIVRGLAENLPGLDKDWYTKAVRELSARERTFCVEWWSRTPPPEEPETESQDEPRHPHSRNMWNWYEATGAKLLRKRKPTRREQIFVRIFLLMEEIGNGGLDQFYTNPYSGAAIGTVQALRTIGANSSAEHLEKANRLFPGGKPARSQEKRIEQYDRLSDKALHKLETVHEPAIYNGEDDWLQLLHDWYDGSR